MSKSCYSHTHFSVNDVRKSYLPILKDPVLISPFSPQVNPSSSLSRSTQSSHTLCHLSKPRESIATSISHISCIFQSHKKHSDLHLYVCFLAFHDSSTSLFLPKIALMCKKCTQFLTFFNLSVSARNYPHHVQIARSLKSLVASLVANAKPPEYIQSLRNWLRKYAQS